MYALLVSTLTVAIAEIGDKTQLLALVLAARYRAPWTIAAGILVATLANHGLAGIVGELLAVWVPHGALRVAVGLGFLAMAAWALKPDTLDDDDTAAARQARWGAFATTLVVFFIAEMGDKTQVATVILAARFEGLALVILGTTVGMLLANLPVVFLGNALATRLPLTAIRRVTAVLFAVMGAGTLLGFTF